MTNLLSKFSCFAALGSLMILTQACNRNLSDGDLKKIQDMVQARGGVGGGSGEEDTPVTMSGGSMSIQLWPDTAEIPQYSWKHDKSSLLSHSKSTGRYVKSVDVWVEGNDYSRIFHNTDAWRIFVEFKNGKDRGVTFTTTPSAEGLSLTTDGHDGGKFSLYSFLQVGPTVLQHPRKASELGKIVFETGAGSSNLTTGCRQNSGKVECDCTGKKGDCTMVIHYCSGITLDECK